jgi:hypothetical protein
MSRAKAAGLRAWFDSARLAADYRPKGFNPLT